MLKILLCLLLCFVSWCQAADLAWNASVVDAEHAAPDGYRIHWGAAPGVYTGQADAGNALTWHIPDDWFGQFYFAASAYNSGGSSGFSNEVLFTREPQQYTGATGLLASRYQVEAHMAVTIPQAAVSRYDGGYGTALVQNSCQIGDLLVLLISGLNGQTVTGVSTTGSTGATGSWSQAAVISDAGESSTTAQIWFASVTSAGNISAAPTGSASDAGYSLHIYRGCVTSSQQDGSGQTAIAVSSATNLSTGTIATSVADAVLVAIYANESGDITADWTYGSPDFTQRTNESGHIHKTADCILSSTGTYGCGLSWSGGRAGVLAMAAFKGTATAGSSAVPAVMRSYRARRN